MSLRGVFRFVVAFLVFAALLIPSFDAVAARPLLQADDEDAAAETGVEGRTYQSPSFGYSLTWDEEWEISDEQIEADYNLLHLQQGDHSVYFEGYAVAEDAQACLDSAVVNFGEIEGVSDLEPVEDADDPDAGAEGDRAWAVYSLTYTNDEGEAAELTRYFDCRVVVEGESVLLITQLTGTDEYEDSVERLTDLLADLSLEGAAPGDADGEADDDTGDDPGDTEGDAEGDEPADDEGTGGEAEATGDLAAFIETSARDIDAFWAREFPLIAAGAAYEPPTDYLPFDRPVDSDCGQLAPMEVGPAYCPLDKTVYYDLEFGQLQVDQFDSRSVIAVTIAHEAGHHVQHEMGWAKCQETPCLDPMELTSQEWELQADCFAGAWTTDAETRGRLGSLDIETNVAQFAVLLGDQGIGNTADPGAHGKGARRVFSFLTGYYGGVTECLKLSPATDPALNGGISADGQPVDEPADDPQDQPIDEPQDEPADEPTDEPSGDALAMGEEYEVQLEDFELNGEQHTGEVLKVTVTETDIGRSVEGIDAEGRFLVVYFSFERVGSDALSLNYSSFVLEDGEGNRYTVDEEATDALIKTVLDNGIDEPLEANVQYDLAVVFDVPADAADFTIMADNGTNPVKLDR